MPRYVAPGSVVRLLSGGPEMTVLGPANGFSPVSDANTVVCAYAQNDTIIQVTLSPMALEVMRPPPPEDLYNQYVQPAPEPTSYSEQYIPQAEMSVADIPEPLATWEPYQYQAEAPAQEAPEPTSRYDRLE